MSWLMEDFYHFGMGYSTSSIRIALRELRF